MIAAARRSGRLAPAHILALAAAVAVSAACARAEPTSAAAPVEVPHGHVEGAQETAEAQARLVVSDPGTGSVRVLDLLTEEVVEVARVDGVEAVTGDGRHAYLTTSDGALHIVDSGGWSVEHGDHVHYYRGQVRTVGSLPGPEPVAVHGDHAVSAVARADGSVQLLDRARLDEGAVAELGTIARSPHRGPAVPYEGYVLASRAEPGHDLGSGVTVHARDGVPVTTIDVPCPQLRGAASTRRGVVFGCADGALLITGSDREGEFRGEKIAYPQPVPDAERARTFHHRPSSATLAARAGDTGVWILDVAGRTWSRVPTGPVVAANTAGAGTPLLTLTADGVLHSYDAGTGREIATAALPGGPVEAGIGDEAGARPTILVDPNRAYVNDPESGAIHEIDYADGLRRSRTFSLDGSAGLVVETGR